MSILIKGLKMPEACGKCFVGDREICSNGCPLIELPDHGDLIDADLLKEECKEPEVWWETETQMKGILANAPVVIPAERSEE